MNEHKSIRFELLQRLKLELVGPNRVREQLTGNDRPSQRYLSGLLWPQGSRIDEGEDERAETQTDGEESGIPESIPPLQQSMNPSSIGLSFVVRAGVKAVRVTASWGEYKESITENGETVWKRIPMQFSHTLELTEALGKRRSAHAAEGVVLEWLVRRLGDQSAVSLFLVNRRQKPEQGVYEDKYLFQPRLRVRSLEPVGRPFAARVWQNENKFDRPDDVLTDELLYREQTVFGVGHGTAVKWLNVSTDRQAAGHLKTTTLPYYEIPKVVPPDWNRGGSLDMNRLAEVSNGEEATELLTPLANAYHSWIEEQFGRIDQLGLEMKSTAELHLEKCRMSLKRIREGIAWIAKEPLVLDAFRFANRAMADQRTQSIWAKRARKSNDWSQGLEPVKAEWRPFQIGFILQSLAGCIDPYHPDRETADLLWFPTGGGKTEAYLGLAAFVIALRRLRGEVDGCRGDAGVTVLMRYTLRLLTIQQFQRASTLICACEQIRKKNPQKWGEAEFRIGLWVGGNSSPNSFEETVKALEKIRKGEHPQGTPIQLVSCPWCGSPLTDKNYIVKKNDKRLYIGCSRKECEYSLINNKQGIPALVEDEEIYRLAPTMLIGTVDKFARMPWVGETQSLFGHVLGEVQNWGFVTEGEHDSVQEVRNNPLTLTDKRPLLPPDLIIQDELHLIGGPLGTMVGLYESAIDWLASVDKNEEVRRPKIIASTATIRRADEQVRKLFSRGLAVFPSPGVDARDSFFALEQPLEKVPGRLYAGIYAPGRSVKTALVRVYASMLASTAAMKDWEDCDMDTYHTLVGYFNSLRELGGAVRLMEDDVHSRMAVLEKRNHGQHFTFEARKMEGEIPELTSRVDSRSIPLRLEQLERPFSKDAKEKAVDVVLASNMISVGVDVSRLGLMVVTGQPKTTSEYIQATSRVGREFPGLVLTVYNWARPRDVSHYERFNSYHAALYRYVEAISVTPYSSRARDRGLAAAIISMSRLRGKGLAPRRGAGSFQPASPDVQLILKRMLERVERVEGPARRDEVEGQMDNYLDLWADYTAKDYLVYSGDNKLPRLMRSLGTKDDETAFAVPNSMRDVEPTIGIYLKRG